MIQSAARTTSRLCSMTSNEWPGIDQPAERAQQFRDIVEMQAGGRLIEQEQRALRGAAAPAVRAAFFSAALFSD